MARACKDDLIQYMFDRLHGNEIQMILPFLYHLACFFCFTFLTLNFLWQSHGNHITLISEALLQRFTLSLDRLQGLILFNHHQQLLTFTPINIRASALPAEWLADAMAD
ncbi:hypothetical protein GQX74_008498 [Glossina fuscipes]|nr:hypothetical protein GQX74_008498 [Glossina fuscipes]